MFVRRTVLTFFNSQIVSVGARRNMGLTVCEVVSRLQNFAPLSLAESWDNVGLLVDPMSPRTVDNVLLTNDLTEEVVEEAIQLKAGLIVSYHPNIFRGMKAISSRTWKERIIVQCIRNEIAVFSPHTTWDSVIGGVNDWLGSAFQCINVIPIVPSADNPLQGAGRLLTLQEEVTVEIAVNKIKQHIGIPHVRLAMAKGKNHSSPIRSIALCAGSGHSVLAGVQADLYLTGEMLHHDILEATQNGISVVLCNHSDSERGFLRVFQDKLKSDIFNNSIEVFVSNVDKDPLVTV